METKNTKFAENLRAMRGEAKLSQREVAEAIGVSQQCVSDWEHGNADPTLTSLWRLADLFGVSIDILCGRTEW